MAELQRKQWKKPGKEQLLIGVLFGILLLVVAVPTESRKEEKEPETAAFLEPADSEDAESRLQEVLSQIAGVGKTCVCITYEDEGVRVVEKDREQSSSLIRETADDGRNTVTTEESTTETTVYTEDETPFVIREKLPQVCGVLIVAEGGGSAAVQEQISRAVQALFGLEAHKISIMKMEVSR